MNGTGATICSGGNRRDDRLGFCQAPATLFFLPLKASAVNRQPPIGDRDAHLVQPPVNHAERVADLKGPFHFRPDSAKLRHQSGRFFTGKCRNGR